MKANGKLSEDVNLDELATITKNFSGAELEGLVRAAQSCALNRLVKVSFLDISFYRSFLLNKSL